MNFIKRLWKRACLEYRLATMTNDELIAEVEKLIAEATTWSFEEWYDAEDRYGQYCFEGGNPDNDYEYERWCDDRYLEYLELGERPEYTGGVA